jgi:endonuclease/exonuclease/phosphatase family metal-dependent hydrolase
VSPSIRAATFNIRHGARADGTVDHHALRLDCDGLRADVLGLQEVDRGRARSDGEDQAALVARSIGLDSVYGPVLRRGPIGEYGNALLTRGRMHDVKLMQLPRPSAREPRGAIIARVQHDDRSFTVATTHLQHHPVELRHLAAEAPIQLRALIEELDDWPVPRILSGDLNLSPPRAVPVLVDAGYQVAASEPTFPSDAPRLTLDYVAVIGFEVVDVEVVATSVSDHRAVVASLRFR